MRFIQFTCCKSVLYAVGNGIMYNENTRTCTTERCEIVMERIDQLSVETFVKKLAEDTFPSPASGSAAATIAAMAASLLEMSCKVTMKKGRELQVDLDKVREVRKSCLALATEDMEVLAAIIQAGKKRKEDPDSYEKAVVNATETLVSMAEQCEYILKEIKEVISVCDKRVFAELIGACEMAGAAGKSAILGVEANLYLLDDGPYKEEVQNKIRKTSKTYNILTEEIMAFTKG